MSDISVEPQPDGTFRVVVRQGKSSTTHLVSVSDRMCEELGCPDVTVDELMHESFEFLLEREPSSSILRRFRLMQIADYFPEYPSEIRRRLTSR